MSDYTGLWIGSSGQSDEYQLIQPKGRGGDAPVYEARSRDNVIVAAKLYDPREINTLSQMTLKTILHGPASRVPWHENLTKVRQDLIGPAPHREREAQYDMGNPEAQWKYLILKWIDGINLREYIAVQRGDLRPLAGAGSGLHALNVEGLIHGDVKPSNLMVDRLGTGRLVDLGTIREIGTMPGDSVPRSGPFTDSLSATEPADIRHDAYALAVTGIYSLFGGVPDWGDSELGSKLKDRIGKAASDRLLAAIRHELVPDVDLQDWFSIFGEIQQADGDTYRLRDASQIVDPVVDPRRSPPSPQEGQPKPRGPHSPTVPGSTTTPYEPTVPQGSMNVFSVGESLGMSVSNESSSLVREYERVSDYLIDLYWWILDGRRNFALLLVLATVLGLIIGLIVHTL